MISWTLQNGDTEAGYVANLSRDIGMTSLLSLASPSVQVSQVPKASKPKAKSRVDIAMEFIQCGIRERKSLVQALIGAGCTPAGASTFASKALKMHRKGKA